jgi:phenylalanyl-tRNA synthetase alpha chain
MDDLNKLCDELLGAVELADSAEALEELRVSVLGKKGRLTSLMKTLGQLSPDERREAGQALNTVKGAFEEAFEARKATMGDAALEAQLESETVDVTLPVRPEAEGRLHPISQTLDEIVAILGEMGFSIGEGPDIEDDFHNFTALNIPPEHPARQMHDTFYLPEKEDGSRMVLRTHTSPVQIRAMQAAMAKQDGSGMPLRIIAPGRTYRCDSDMTHTPMFHQVEGLIVDKTGRTFGGNGYRLHPQGRRIENRRRRRLAGNSRLRHGEPQGAGRLRNRPVGLSGVCLRYGYRASRDAEIRHTRSAHLLRRRSALAASLRFPAA